MRCPVCGALYLHHTDNAVFTCPQGHEWHWNSDTRTVTYHAPPESKMIMITVVKTPPDQEIATWEGEGGR